MDNNEKFYRRFIQLWTNQQGRDRRHAKMDKAIAGKWDLIYDDEMVDSLAPNLIHASLSDIVGAASALPTIRVEPFSESSVAKESASHMRMACEQIFKVSNMEKTIKQFLWDLVAYGHCSAVIARSPEDGTVRIEHREARYFYPEIHWRPSENIKEAMFIRQVDWTSLPTEYQNKLNRPQFTANSTIPQIVLVDWIDNNMASLWAATTATVDVGQVAMGDKFNYSRDSTAHGEVVMLKEWNHNMGLCPIVAQQVNTFDGQPRGLHDQTIPTQRAYGLMHRMIMDYTEQMTYAITAVSGLSGNEIEIGGGTFVELERDGSIQRVAPPSPTPAVYENLDQLKKAIHEGSRWSSSRTGEVDTSIASAKYLEASAGTLNTLIRELHIDMKDFLERALITALQVQQEVTPTDSYVSSNQEMKSKFNPKKFNFDNDISVEYSIALGRTPQEAVVAQIQYYQNNLISKKTAIEAIEGIHNADREEARIDTQKLEDLMFQQLAQMILQQQIPADAISKMAEARREGKGISELFDEYVVKPQAEAAANQLVGPQGEAIGQAGGALGGAVPSLPPEQALGALPSGR